MELQHPEKQLVLGVARWICSRQEQSCVELLIWMALRILVARLAHPASQGQQVTGAGPRLEAPSRHAQMRKAQDLRRSQEHQLARSHLQMLGGACQRFQRAGLRMVQPIQLAAFQPQVDSGCPQLPRPCSLMVLLGEWLQAFGRT